MTRKQVILPGIVIASIIAIAKLFGATLGPDPESAKLFIIQSVASMEGKENFKELNELYWTARNALLDLLTTPDQATAAEQSKTMLDNAYDRQAAAILQKQTEKFQEKLPEFKIARSNVLNAQPPITPELLATLEDKWKEAHATLLPEGEFVNEAPRPGSARRREWDSMEQTLAQERKLTFISFKGTQDETFAQLAQELDPAVMAMRNAETMAQLTQAYEQGLRIVETLEGAPETGRPLLTFLYKTDAQRILRKQEHAYEQTVQTKLQIDEQKALAEKRLQEAFDRANEQAKQRKEAANQTFLQSNEAALGGAIPNEEIAEKTEEFKRLVRERMIEVPEEEF